MKRGGESMKHTKGVRDVARRVMPRILMGYAHPTRHVAPASPLPISHVECASHYMTL